MNSEEQWLQAVMAHPLVQGWGMATVLALAVWVFTGAFRRTPAVLRHTLWRGVLVLFWIAPLTLWGRDLLSLPTFTVRSPVPVAEKLPERLRSPVPIAEKPLEGLRPSLPVAEKPPSGARAPAEPIPGTVPPLTGRKAGPSAPKESETFSPSSSFPLSQSQFPWLGILLWLWLGGIVVGGGGLLRDFRTVQRLRRVARAIGNETLSQRIAYWAVQLGLRRPVRVAESEAVAVPVLMGLWRPLLVLPTGFDVRTNTALEAVLIHELAHLRQGHLGTLALARLTSILLWWHPLVWLTEACLRATAEELCDDWAVALTTSRQGYAAAMVQLAEKAIPSAGGLAFVRGGHPVVQRVRRILTEALPPVVRVSRSVRWALTGGIAVLLLGLAGVRLIAQPPPGPVTVSGTVREAGTDQPAAGMPVRLMPSSAAGRELDGERQITTDGQGKFLLEDVPAGPYRISLEGEVVPPFFQELQVAAGMKPVLLRHYRGGVVTGQVRHTDPDRPVAGGVVFAVDPVTSREDDPPDFLSAFTASWRVKGQEIDFNRPPWQELEGLPRTLTDAAGNYELPHVLEGHYILYAVAPGRGCARRDSVPVREGRETSGIDFGISPERDRQRITGRLTGPDEKPLEKVKVAYQLSSNGGFTRYGGSVDAGLAGHYQISSSRSKWARARPGPFALAVKVEGFRATEREGIELGKNGVAGNVDFQLEPLSRGGLGGRVFRPDGETPAAGIWVVPVRPGRHWLDADKNRLITSSIANFDGQDYVAGRGQATRTDEEGRYRIEHLEAGPYRVYALPRTSRYGGLWNLPTDPPSLDPGLEQAASALSDAVIVPEEGIGEVNVILRPGGTIEGVVRDAENGEPIADAWVPVRRWGHRTFSFDRGSWEGERTDAQGRFRVPGLSPGTYRLSASGPGDRVHFRSEVTLTAGATVPVELKMWEWLPTTVTGRVLRPDGRTPAPLAYVSIGPTETPVRTDADGRFELTALRELFRVKARKVGYGLSTSNWLHPAPGQPPQGLVLTLAEAGTVSGRIIWDGPPETPEDVVVMALSPEESVARITLNFPPFYHTNQMFYRPTRPDAEGRFTLTDVTVGPNHLVVFVNNIPRLVQQGVRVELGQATAELILKVPPARGQISGTITAAESGTPLSRVDVTVFNEWFGDYHRRSRTDDKGRYTLSGLPAGTYQVFADPPHRASRASPEVTVDNDSVERVDFLLTSGGKVTGTIRGADGKPVPLAAVATRSRQGWALGPIPPQLSRATAVANQDGRYTLAPLAPGAYTLYFFAPGYPERQLEGVVVREGETTAGVNWTLRVEE